MSQLDAILERHQAFWESGPVDRPLIGSVRTPQNPIMDFDWGFPPGEGILEPEMIEVHHLLPQFEAYFAAGAGPLDRELFWPCVPTRSIPWIEAIVGAPIRYANAPGSLSIFADHSLDGWPLDLGLPTLDESPWFHKLMELTVGLVQLSGGEFPIAGSHARGPWDVMSALRSMTALFTDLYDVPERLVTHADRLADLWVQLTDRLEAVIPEWHGGHVGIFGVWAPGYTPTAQNDASTSVSPGLYLEVMEPADRKTCAPWRYQMFHTHSGGWHLLETMAGFLEGGRALNVVVDPNGPSLDDLLSVLRRLQDRRVPLHLAVFEWRDVDRLARALRPNGLAITCAARDGARPTET